MRVVPPIYRTGYVPRQKAPVRGVVSGKRLRDALLGQLGQPAQQPMQPLLPTQRPMQPLLPAQQPMQPLLPQQQSLQDLLVQQLAAQALQQHLQDLLPHGGGSLYQRPY